MPGVSARIRVGVCSWADETLTKVWYPKEIRSGEERLRYYAERFDVVEANSTYYRLPERELVARWAERVPDGFTMHVKVFGAMTRHPVKAEQLPPDLRDVPLDEHGRVHRPPHAWRAEVFRRFVEALEPLREQGKLGALLFQLPSYIVFKASSLHYLEWAQAQLPGYELLVEFRHRSWLDEEHRAETLRFLEQRGLGYVVVDAPRSAARNLVDTVVAATTPTAYVRFHGRNERTWSRRVGSAAERFDYLYSDDELREWVPPLRELARQAEAVFAMFNNNGRSGEGSSAVAQAPTNARMLQRLLEETPA
jgi:uncharacterized protein YecE (DUF72 family)